MFGFVAERGYPLGKYWLRHTILSRSRDLNRHHHERRPRGDHVSTCTRETTFPLEPTLSIGRHTTLEEEEEEERV